METTSTKNKIGRIKEMNKSSLISLLGTLTLLVSYVRARQKLREPFIPVDDKGRVQFLFTTRSMVVTLWPFVLSTFARGNGIKCAIPSMLWMAGLWWLDTRRLSVERDDALTTVKDLLQRGVRIETNTVTALTFGLCGLAGARSDTAYTRYIIYALILCILVVMPQLELSPEDPMSLLISEVQRGVLVHGIATVVTCVCLTRTPTIRATF